MTTLSSLYIEKILRDAKTIAVVGVSAKPEKDSFRVMQFLLDHGYNVFPVNPAYKEILGLKCYGSLQEIPDLIDIVDIFRRSEDVKPIVDDAIAVKAKTVWMQLGIINEEAASAATNAGMNVIMNKCIKIEYASLVAR